MPLKTNVQVNDNGDGTVDIIVSAVDDPGPGDPEDYPFDLLMGVQRGKCDWVSGPGGNPVHDSDQMWAWWRSLQTGDEPSYTYRIRKRAGPNAQGLTEVTVIGLRFPTGGSSAQWAISRNSFYNDGGYYVVLNEQSRLVYSAENLERIEYKKKKKKDKD